MTDQRIGVARIDEHAVLRIVQVDERQAHQRNVRRCTGGVDIEQDGNVAKTVDVLQAQQSRHKLLAL